MSAFLQLHEAMAKKRESVAALRKELQSLLEEWFVLENDMRPELTAKYDALFGSLEIEIQRKALEAADIGRRTELLTIKQQRGEHITDDVIRLVNIIVDNEFKRFRQRLYDDISGPAAKQNISQSKTSDGELPQMYRAIVKKLHPDISDATDKFQKYWNAVQTAFETKNTTQMRALYAVLTGTDSNEYNMHFQNSEEEFADLERQEYDLQQKVGGEQRKILRLRAEEPFIFADRLDQPEWIEEREKFLRRQIEQKEREIKYSKELFRELTGYELTSKTEIPPNDKNKNPEQFSDSDFFDNTYFGSR